MINKTKALVHSEAISRFLCDFLTDDEMILESKRRSREKAR